jgi:fibronectin type 3 domain-containing protein
MKSFRSTALILVLVAVALGSALAPSPARAAADVTLQVDVVTASDLAGYRIYQSATSGQYNRTTGKVCDIAAGTTSCTVAGLADGVYYFVATAYDKAGNESTYSNEITVSLDSTPPASPKNLRTISVKVTATLSNGQPAISVVATTGGK